MTEENDGVLVEFEITYTIKVQWCEDDDLTSKQIVRVQNLTDEEVLREAQAADLLPNFARMSDGNINVRRTKVFI